MKAQLVVVANPRVLHFTTRLGTTVVSAPSLVSRIVYLGVQGLSGPRGLASAVPGPTGPQGPPGFTYTHTEPLDTLTWMIHHGLNKHPSVTVVDSALGVVGVQPTYTDLNTVTITFLVPRHGVAYLN